MKAREIANYIEKLAPIESGIAGDELGFIYGEPNSEVTAAAVTWSPTAGVLADATAKGANFVICHEPLFFKAGGKDLEGASSNWFEEAPDEEKIPNKKRLQFLKAGAMMVYRAHTNWDIAPRLGVIDALATKLSLGQPIGRGKATRVYEVQPITLRDLADKVKTKLALKAVRVMGDPRQSLTKVGLAVGGLGQMFNSPEELAMLGAEVGIFGEMLDYTFRCARELNLAIIETSHVASENPGMQSLAEALQDHFPEVKFLFLDSKIPWFFL